MNLYLVGVEVKSPHIRSELLNFAIKASDKDKASDFALVLAGQSAYGQVHGALLAVATSTQVNPEDVGRVSPWVVIHTASEEPL